ncbi:MAG TPA: DNA mismatch repair protein MutL [Clostridiales bacterium]|jgi:uncharacterized protein (TIGR01319 family)|nr:DNA mismatch repair protein MutL [Clostridiales bacterium]
MKIDLAVAEIGSTTTIVNAFDDISGDARFIGQGVGYTTVLEGDVRIGLSNAFKDLEKTLGEKIEAKEMFATSSAAGGLKMCVHGLVYDMTVKAAHAAALGAGAIVKLATAGKLHDYDIDEIRDIAPNLILIAGGTDYGERECALHNARLIAKSGINVPVIYAGNVQNQKIIAQIFREANVPCYIVENVYPKLDLLNIEPTRRKIHDVFEEHIIKAKGMEHVRDMVNGPIIPTPGAVMEAAKLLYEDIGDLVVIDIGGATTDVHSVSLGSEAIASIQTTPEPFAKRTVEGDLGLFVNARHVIESIGKDKLERELSLDIDKELETYTPIPQTSAHTKIAQRLCVEAGVKAFMRHAGSLRYVYTPSGRQTLAEGKDLTLVKYVIGTGGALTRLPERERLLREIANCNANGTMLAPAPDEAEILFDDDYIFASAGVIAKKYPQAALKLMKNSMKWRN